MRKLFFFPSTFSGILSSLYEYVSTYDARAPVLVAFPKNNSGGAFLPSETLVLIVRVPPFSAASLIL